MNMKSTETCRTDEKYKAGDNVYNKHVDSLEWKGPGVIVGQDASVLFVRPGGTHIRVHHLKVRKVKTDNVAHVIDDDMENDTCTEQRQPDETQSTEKITTEVSQGLGEAEPTGRTTRGENLTSPQMQRRHSH